MDSYNEIVPMKEHCLGYLTLPALLRLFQQGRWDATFTHRGEVPTITEMRSGICLHKFIDSGYLAMP